MRARKAGVSPTLPILYRTLNTLRVPDPAYTLFSLAQRNARIPCLSARGRGPGLVDQSIVDAPSPESTELKSEAPGRHTQGSAGVGASSSLTTCPRHALHLVSISGK